MKQTYELHIETNKYAGNFEREMCAFLTGVIGECGVGDSEQAIYKEEESYEFEIRQVADEHGVERPVVISGEGYESLTIFLYEPLNDTEIEIIKRRLPIFAEQNNLVIKSVKEVIKEVQYKEIRTI